MVQKTEFAVQFKIYQYNSGAADNGVYPFEKKFPTPDEAIAFHALISGYMNSRKRRDEDEAYSEEYQDFVQKYVWGGFLYDVKPIITRVTLEEVVGEMK